MNNDQIVELCSAANEAEAYALCGLLEEAGIHCRVVGDVLAAGGLPLGQPTTPRIWVREPDVARAREIIAAHAERAEQDESEPIQAEDESEEEPDDAEGGEEDEQITAEQPGVWLRWLSRALTIAAAMCFLIGGVWTWYSWMTIRLHPASAEGVIADAYPHSKDSRAAQPVILVPRPPPKHWLWYDLKYTFTVNGATYYAIARAYDTYEHRAPIHYDPQHPEDNVVGPLTQPANVLISTFLLGAFCMLVAVVCRNQAARRDIDALDINMR